MTETLQQEKQGTFTVELQRVTWQLAASSSSPLDASESGAASERQSLWMLVQLVRKNGQLLDKLWFPGDDDNTLTKSIQTPTHSPRGGFGDDGNDETMVHLQYQQSSKAMPLTKDTLETLLNAQLQISVYSGAARSRTTDELLGEQQLSLMGAVMNHRLQEKMSIPMPAIYREFSIDVCIQADVDLADFANGCRVLRFHSLALVNLPKEWTLPCGDDEEAVQLCAAPEQNPATYELEIRFPELASSASETTARTESFVLSGGKLQYEPSVASISSSPTDSESTPGGDTSATTPRLTGTWSVTFPSTAVIAKLFLKSSVDRLVDFIHIEKHIDGTLRRTVAETAAAKLPDVLTSSVRIHLAELVRPGNSRMLACVKIKDVRPVPRESLEQELASVASNDEKKKIQAALADYESVAQQAALLSSALSASGTQIESIIEIFNSPLVLEPPAVPLPSSMSIEEMIPQRDLVEEHEQRTDSIADLRTEIRRVVVTLLREYDDSFHASHSSSDLAGNSSGRDDKKQKLIFKLNTQGVYHNFKETLKKRIIPVIRDRFARSETADDAEEDDKEADEPQLQLDGNGSSSDTQQQPKANEKKKEYFGHLYALVMEEVHTVLHEAIYCDIDALEKTSASMQSKPSEKEIAAVLDSLKLKAMENEANGDAEKSETMYLDRIAYAEEHALLLCDDHSHHQHQSHNALHHGTAHPSPNALESVWYDYARFSLVQGDFEKAGTNLRQCLSLNAHALPALLGYTSLLCELKDFVHAEGFGKTTVTQALAAYSASTFSGVTKRIWTDVVLAHALLAFYFVQSGKDTTGNLALFELLKAQQILQRDGGEHYKNACLSSVWIFLIEYTHELKLRSVTQSALQCADSFRKSRDVLSAQERVIKRAIEADLSLASGESDRAVKLLRDALEIDPSHPFAWLVLGKAYLLKENQTETAIECLQRALGNHRSLRSDELRLGLYVHLGLVLLQASQFAPAETVFLQSCDEFRVASNWLGVGIACLRMEKWEPAHMALAEANRLDASNPDVWGYLALLALSASPQITARGESEAKRFVEQALRYNLSNPVLLRELSNGFIAIDRLEDAEKLLRRSLVCQDSSLTRKTLADVLAAQNCAEDALRQYKQTLDASDSVRERCGLLEECAKLLTTLGRPEEANEYRKMANQFQIDAESAMYVKEQMRTE